jgi:hypothetical protein
VQALFVTRPVVLGFESISTKGTLEQPWFFVRICPWGAGRKLSSSAPFLRLQAIHRAE